MRIAILFPILAVLLSACLSPEERAQDQKVLSLQQTPEILKSTLADGTVVSRDPNSFIEEHGTKVEYHAADGRSFLWYPGNRSVVVGQWDVRADQNGRILLCYKYGNNTYNPVTQRRGGQWNCSRSDLQVSELLIGNPFGLKAGPVPKIIPDRRPYYPEHIQIMLGRDPATLRYVTGKPNRPRLAENYVDRVSEELSNAYN